MKIARVFSVVFGIIGAVLMLGTVVLCLISLDAPVRMAEVPEAAVACSEEMMEALAAGDFAAAAGFLYGQPDLGVDHAPTDVIGEMVWNAFTDSISYEFAGECYATDSGIFRDVTITALEIPSVTENLQTRAQALLTEKMEAAEDMTELYDEENNFREALIDQTLREAAEQAIREDARTVTRDVTLKLIHRDDRWWAVPDQALLQTIAGGVA